MDDARYYVEACDDLTEDEEAFQMSYPGLTADSACNWTVVGFTEEGLIDLTNELIKLGSYTETLRANDEMVRDILKQVRELQENTKTVIKEN